MRPAGAHASGRQDAGPPGAGGWVRCFAEELRPVGQPAPGAAAGPWRLRVTSRQPFGTIAFSLFDDDPGADSVLTVVDDPAERGTCAMLLDAAREAVSAGGLIVIGPAPGLTGLCASLHAEHPQLGVTLIRAPLTQEGLSAARQCAAVTPGRFRQVVLGASGSVTEPVVVQAGMDADGTFPLGPADVILVTGMTCAGDLACATSLASRGAALAVIAAPGPEDPLLATCLADLRAAGVRVHRKKADLADRGQVASAVRSLERGLGPVTAVVHAAGAGPAEPLGRLLEPALRNFVIGQQVRLGNVLGAVAPERVRVLVTFGSVAGWYGAPGAVCDALASAQLAQQAARFAERAAAPCDGRPGCRVQHVDWAPWEGPAGGTTSASRLAPLHGFVPVGVEEGSRLLLAMLTSPQFPARVAVHGRLGVPGATGFFSETGWPSPAGRFLEDVRVHYPGVELVAEARLSLRTDPYLSDYEIHGLPVFPAVMALEAMAQAASAVAGAPLRRVAGVTMAAPVVLPAGTPDGGTVVRVCALAHGDRVETVLRSAESGFRVDHARAEFRPAVSASPNVEDAGQASPEDTGQARAVTAAPGGIVDGTDLYGQVFFQRGRFRRVAFLPEVSSRACRDLVRGGDDQPWFGELPGSTGAPLVLGSPGLNDATLHVLQACQPDQRTLPVAQQAAVFSGREVRGALQVRALRRPASDGAGDVWDVVAVDATGQCAVTWTGVRLGELGPLAAGRAWHPALLAVALETRAAELGIDPTLRAAITCGRGWKPSAPAPGVAGEGQVPGGGQWADSVAGRGPLDGFELTVRAANPVACRWEPAGPPGNGVSGLVGRVRADPGLAALLTGLTAWTDHTEAGALACYRSVESCLEALGRQPGAPCTAEPARDGGWLVVRSGCIRAACTITCISGIPGQVVLAVASSPALLAGHFARSRHSTPRLQSDNDA